MDTPFSDGEIMSDYISAVERFTSTARPVSDRPPGMPLFIELSVAHDRMDKFYNHPLPTSAAHFRPCLLDIRSLLYTVAAG